jgi:hypothetical protein
MVMGIHMDTDILRGAMSICYNNNKRSSSSSRMRGRITSMRYWTIQLERRQNPHASESESADGQRALQTLSAGYGRCMVQGQQVVRGLVRAAVKGE